MHFITLIAVFATCVFATQFDTSVGEGKRNYNCLRVVKPTGKTLKTNQDIGLQIAVNKAAGCKEFQASVKEQTKYRIEIFNDPHLIYDSAGPAIHAEQRLTLAEAFVNGDHLVLVGGSSGLYLPWVKDDKKWYLSVSTYFEDLPQFPSVFSTIGPLTIERV